MRAEQLCRDKSLVYVMLRDRPCAINEITKNKDDKIVFIGTDVLTQTKIYQTVRNDTIMTGFAFLKREFRLMSIENDVFHFQSTRKNNMESVVVNEWYVSDVENYETTNISMYSEPHNNLHKILEKMYIDNKDAIILVNINFAPNRNLKWQPIITSCNKIG
jgi:translation elongation factor P/translation initiation factor 5A